MFLFLLISDYSFSQYSLQGDIIDKEANTVISSVNVKIRNIDTGDEQKTKSNISGKYKFENLTKGTYEITATHIGYKSYSDKIIINEINQNIFNIIMETIEVEIEKVNITSTKTEVTLQQTPSSISIVSSEDISRKNYSDICIM